VLSQVCASLSPEDYSDPLGSMLQVIAIISAIHQPRVQENRILYTLMGLKPNTVYTVQVSSAVWKSAPVQMKTK
jgi:hypothetical protein